MNAFLNFMIILKDKSKSAFLKIFENQNQAREAQFYAGWITHCLRWRVVSVYAI